MQQGMDHLQGRSRRTGAIRRDPLKPLISYALANGVPAERVENLIGTLINSANDTGFVPAIAGPILFSKILDYGIGTAPPLEIAQTAPFSFFTGLERAVLLAPNGREALMAFARNFALFHTVLVPKFEQTDQYTYFSFRHLGEERDNGACNEVVLAVLVRLMRLAFGRLGQPFEVRLRYTRNGTTRAYEDFFACRVTHNSSDKSFGLVYRTADTEASQQNQATSLFRFAMDRLNRLAQERAAQTHQTEYLELINCAQACAREGAFKTTDIAFAAGHSERKAQRLAQQYGTSLREIVARTRLTILTDQLILLPETDAETLSSMLGFSDRRALRRALKSWTGTGLGEFRNHFKP